MDPERTKRLAQEAEAKLDRALPLTREERLALLARLLALQETRKERGYGNT